MSSKGERLQDEGSQRQVVVAGGAAGLIARFVVAPLDVVKIRLQLQTHSLSDPVSQRHLGGGPVYKGTLPTLRHILAHEGVAALWKGNVPAELLYVCYSAAQFTAYRGATLVLQRARAAADRPPAPHVDAFAAGAAAGAAATAATYPLDLLRTRFAAQGSGADRVYTSLRGAVRAIARDEGARGFFRGLGPALLQIAPYMGAFFALYEALRPPLNRAAAVVSDRLHASTPPTPTPPPSTGSATRFSALAGAGDVAAGALAAVTAKTLVFPLDLVRKRIQVQGPTRSRYVHKNIPAYEGSVARTLGTILRTEGVRGLYRGLTVSLLKSAPTNAITMWVYERVLRLLVRLEAADHAR